MRRVVDEGLSQFGHVEAVDISNAVLYLASDEARYVTGTTMVVDAGALAPYKIPHTS